MIAEGVLQGSGGLVTWQTMLPAVIFLAEMLVVTLSTIRTIFVARGKRALAALLGFFEISMWLFAIGHVMSNLDQLWCTVGFAAGFTLGNYLGITLEGMLALGTLGVRIYARGDGAPLMDRLKGAGFVVTRMNAEGATGPVTVLTTIIPRRDRHQVELLIQEHAPGQFFVVSDVQETVSGVFPGRPGVRPFPLVQSAGAKIAA